MEQRLPAPIRKILIITFWTALFGLAYAQAPLYTSNQNQYFLHGLAQAGVGALRSDWLANTLDPTPVFSALVTIIYKVIPFAPFFYIVYIFLMGVYLISLKGIAEYIFPRLREPLLNLAFLAAIILFHSAGWRFAVSRLLGDNWTYILEDGVAGQRMLGPVLQPSSFGVLLPLSILLYLRKRPFLAVLSAVLAATIHPTYMLAAAALTLAYMLDTAFLEKRYRQAFVLGGVALIAVAPILVYSLNVFGGSDPQDAVRARQILVDIRIPHHAKPNWWWDATAIFKLVMLATAFAVLRFRRFSILLFVPTLIAVTGTLLQIFSGSTTLALLFPWRISVLLVPLSLAVLLGWTLQRWVGPSLDHNPSAGRFVRLLSLGVIALAVFVGVTRFVLDLQRKADAPERPIQRYVAAHLDGGDLYLVPVKMQDFRLETGAPVYMDFKSIPYKDRDVLEWYRRYQLADRVYIEADCDLLAELGATEGVTRVIFESGSKLETCEFLTRIYEDPYYALYEIPSP